jgi:2,3-bisphosphoglycerate-dependent phosphoglycerate mutase
VPQLVLVRHGQSQWNLENRFTGWVDVPLTAKGEEEAMRAGRLLLAQSFSFDRAYTSYLQRAIHTLWHILKVTDQSWLPVDKHWRLNERHYGGLQGLNKQETKDKFGEDQVFQWRRSYDLPPPPASGSLQEEQMGDRRYQEIDPAQFPQAEALKHTLERVEPYWQSQLVPQIQSGERLLVVAHGNSLRALVKLITQMSDQDITQFEFETGCPLVMDLNSQLELKSMDWLKG